MNQGAILVTVGFNYIGAQGDINIWHPSVESADDYTTAQILLKNGAAYDDFETLESRWVAENSVNLFES